MSFELPDKRRDEDEPPLVHLDRIWPDSDRQERALDLLVQGMIGPTPLHTRRNRPSLEQRRHIVIRALSRIRGYKV